MRAEAADRGEPDSAVFRLVDDAVAVLTSEVGGVGLTMVTRTSWAASSSPDVLRLLLPEITALPVLLLATAREDGLADSRLGRVVSDLLRAPGTVCVPLSGVRGNVVREQPADRRLGAVGDRPRAVDRGQSALYSQSHL